MLNVLIGREKLFFPTIVQIQQMVTKRSSEIVVLEFLRACCGFYRLAVVAEGNSC